MATYGSSRWVRPLISSPMPRSVNSRSRTRTVIVVIMKEPKGYRFLIFCTELLPRDHSSISFYKYNFIYGGGRKTKRSSKKKGGWRQGTAPSCHGWIFAQALLLCPSQIGRYSSTLLLSPQRLGTWPLHDPSRIETSHGCFCDNELFYWMASNWYHLGRNSGWVKSNPSCKSLLDITHPDLDLRINGDLQ